MNNKRLMSLLFATAVVSGVYLEYGIEQGLTGDSELRGGGLADHPDTFFQPCRQYCENLNPDEWCWGCEDPHQGVNIPPGMGGAYEEHDCGLQWLGTCTKIGYTGCDWEFFSGDCPQAERFTNQSY